MITRHGDRVEIVCDSCDDSFTGNANEEFNEVWAAAKRDGWRARKVAGEWLHGCPDCGVLT